MIFVWAKTVWQKFENNTGKGCCASGVILEGAAMEIDADSRSTPTFALLLFHFFFVDNTIMFALLLFQFWFLTFCTYFYFALLIFNFSTTHLLCTYFSTKLFNFRFWHNVGGSSFVSLSESFRVFLLLAPQSGALRISAYRDFQPNPIPIQSNPSTYSFRAFKPFYGDQK